MNLIAKALAAEAARRDAEAMKRLTTGTDGSGTAGGSERETANIGVFAYNKGP